MTALKLQSPHPNLRTPRALLEGQTLAPVNVRFREHILVPPDWVPNSHLLQGAYDLFSNNQFHRSRVRPDGLWPPQALQLKGRGDARSSSGLKGRSPWVDM